MFSIHRASRVICTIVVALSSAGPAAAQGLDLTLFVGRAFPVYDERLTLAPPTPSVPGADVTVVGSPLLEADGGAVFGGALAFEWGIFGIEGRLDATDVGLELTGARYNLSRHSTAVREPHGKHHGFGWQVRRRPNHAPVREREAQDSGTGRACRLGWPELSPGTRDHGGRPFTPGGPRRPDAGRFQSEARASRGTGQADHSWGINGGAGLRIGGRVALVGEVRVFYFREHELRFNVENDLGILDALLVNLEPVRFEPVFVNAQVGVVFKF